MNLTMDHVRDYLSDRSPEQFPVPYVIGVGIVFALLAWCCVKCFAKEPECKGQSFGACLFDGKNGHAHGERPTTDRCGRSCCCLFMVLLCIMMWFAGFYGRPQRLIHGVDYEGRVCGVDAGVETKPFMYWCGIEDRDDPWNNDGLEFPGMLNFHAKTCVTECPTRAAMATIQCLQRNQVEESRLHVADLDTFSIEINQQVVEQTSYPTLASNQMCLPDGNGYLQYQILTNAVGGDRSSGRRIASILNGWWVLLLSGVGAIVLNYALLYFLSSRAGFVLFAQMVGTIVMAAVVGVYFLMALGFWTNDLDGFYQKVNPWYHTFPDSGVLAVLMSTLTGVCFIFIAIGVALATFSEAAHVDETVGLVAAALDCVWRERSDVDSHPMQIGRGSGDLLRLPLFISILLMCCSATLLYGCTYVLSIADVDASMIRYNGEYIFGLYRRLHFEWYTDLLFLFYMFCSMWILEFCLSLGQFTVSYCVVNWYYFPVKNSSEGPLSAPGKKSMVRVVGVDAITDKREAYVETDPNTGQKVMRMFVGKKGPGNKDVIPTPQANWKKRTDTGEKFEKRWVAGLCIALVYHFGSLAKGSLCICLTRPIRVLPNVITSVMVREGATRQVHPLLGKSEKYCNLFGLLATCIDAMLGKFSKDAYTHLVLAHSEASFWESANESQEAVVQAGGVIAFFMGACSLFDFVWAVFMFCFSFLSTLIIIALFPCFTDPTKVTFVADPGCLAVVSACLNTMIGYTFIMTVSHTADTLIFTFCHQRAALLKAGEGAGSITKNIPPSLRNLVSDELSAGPDVKFKPEGTRATHFWHHGTHMLHSVTHAHP